MVVFDDHKNFAESTVATAPSPPASGTSLVVASGGGAKYPTPPFNADVWPDGQQPTTANAEVVRVTAISTDTLTIVRAQEGSIARSILVGDQIVAPITAKTLTDIEALFPIQTAEIGDGQVTPEKILAGAGTSWPWQSWTPTWTNLTVGNGTLNAHYFQIGKFVGVRVGFTLGSTSAVGDVRMSFPVAPKTSILFLTRAKMGSVVLFDSSSGVQNIGSLRIETTTTVRFLIDNAASTYLAVNAISATVPFTWASGDVLSTLFFYEAA